MPHLINPMDPECSPEVVIRKSKPKRARQDRDAVWLLRLAKMNTGYLPSEFTKHAKARLRAIARRLGEG